MHSRSAPGGRFDCVSKDTLSDLHKDGQGGVCEVALKGALEVALEVALELHLWLHFLMQWLMHESVQNNGGLNVGFEWEP